MHIPDSPEVDRARGAHSPSHGEKQHLNKRILPDYSLPGNRRLVRTQCGSELYEVFVISSYYELVSGSETERFNELWEGIVEQIRLAERSAHDAS